MKKLFAISDIHFNFPENRELLYALKPRPGDWLILAGDICHTLEEFREVLSFLSERFEKIIWVPGNHDMWTGTSKKNYSLVKYEKMVEICRAFNGITPEDDYILFNDETENQDYYIVPMMLMYDYSFKPDHIDISGAIKWAMEKNIVCTDEYYIHPYPFSSIRELCFERIAYTKKRLEALDRKIPKILINHYPLKPELVRLFSIPRFSIWCGTTLTDTWHTSYNVHTVVYGHLHMRATDYIDGVRFEEVSLGNPGQWPKNRPIEDFVSIILPDPQPVRQENEGPFWHF